MYRIVREKDSTFVTKQRRLYLEKHRRRNVESFAQFFYVGFVEAAFLVQHFGYDAFRAKDRRQVFLAEIIGVH